MEEFEEQFRKKMMRSIEGLDPAKTAAGPANAEIKTIPAHHKDFSDRFVQETIEKGRNEAS
jgi:hypothetical protein